MSISLFVHHLAQTPPPPNCVNPYRYKRPFSAERRHNLQAYLSLMLAQQPSLLLIGEAPGYRGCRLTGIPFVSPHILQNLLLPNYGTCHPFCPILEWPEYQKEASATIVWRTVGAWQPLPLLWNIFPFHPHQPNAPQTNRTPKQSEIAAGRPFLAQLHRLFPQTQLVAVGQKAATALKKWGLGHTAVRHPSHGGAVQFRHAMSQIAGRKNLL